MFFFSRAVEHLKAQLNRRLLNTSEGEVNHQAVKLVVKNCDEVSTAIAKWIQEQSSTEKQMALKPEKRTEQILQSARFLGLINTACAALHAGTTDREYWLLFDSFVDETNYQTLVIRCSSTGNEVARHSIYA